VHQFLSLYLILPLLKHKSMSVCCFCDKCHGILVNLQTKCNHKRAALKNYLVLQQTIWCPDLTYAETTGGRSFTTTTVSLHPCNMPDPHGYGFINDWQINDQQTNALIYPNNAVLSCIDLAEVTPHNDNCMAFVTTKMISP
jgi:hypothetical protein